MTRATLLLLSVAIVGCGKPAPDPAPPVASRPVTKSVEPDWSGAGTTATVGGFEVSVKSSRIGLVDQRDRSNTFKSKTESLIVEIELRNTTTTEKKQYESWGGAFYESKPEEIGTLTDDIGNSYKRRLYNDAPPVGRTASESLYPGKSLSDVLTFEVPVDAAKTMRLLLPGKRIGIDGDFLLAFPKPAN